MNRKLILPCLLILAALFLPAAASSQTYELSYAQIFTTGSTVDLIPSTSAAGILSGIRCNFSSATAVKVEFNLDGNASSITIDPTNFERESSGSGQYLSGWIPYLNSFGGTSTTLLIDPTSFERESSGSGNYVSGWIPFKTVFGNGHVQLNNTGLGTATITCWASGLYRKNP